MLASPAQNHPDLLWGPSTLLVNRCKGVKRPSFDVDHLFSSSFEIKNKCSCTSTPQCLHGIRKEFIKVSNRLAVSFLKAEDAVVWRIYIYMFRRNQLSPSTGQKPTNQNVATPQKTTLHIDRLKNVR